MSSAPGIASPRPSPQGGTTSLRGRRSLWGAAARQISRVPAAAWVCAAIAVANAFTFSLIVPPFQVPDEPEHYAYTEFLVQAGRPPYKPPPATEFSPQEQAALEQFYFPNLFEPGSFHLPPWTARRAAEAKAALAAASRRRSEGGTTGESENPPLYYALEAIPYEIASGGSLLDRVEAMRFLTTLLFGATVLFVFGFVREALPRPRWVATVAGLIVALQPQVAFIAGGIDDDTMTFAAGAALFWLLARCARRGLNGRRGAAIGLTLAVGTLAKLSFVGMLPGAAIGVALLAFSQRGVTSKTAVADGGAPSSRRWRGPFGDRPALNGLAAAVVVAAVPLVAYVIVNYELWDRSLLGGALGLAVVPSSTPGKPPMTANFPEFLSFLWQFYLPRLPGMRAQFTVYPLWDRWFKGSVGNFGLLDYGFPSWVYSMFLIVFIGLAALAVRALIASRAALRRRWQEIVAYLAIALGLLIGIARVGYNWHLAYTFIFEQARYIFPLLALYGLFMALAVRGAGRRWGGALAGVLVVGALAHTIFAQLLTLHRYWT